MSSKGNNKEKKSQTKTPVQPTPTPAPAPETLSTPTPTTTPTTPTTQTGKSKQKEVKNDESKKTVESETHGEVEAEVETETEVACGHYAIEAMNVYLKDLRDMKLVIDGFIKRGKEIKKLMEKDIKDTKKNSKKKRVRKPDAAPGGFRKPIKISDEMCDFLNIPKGQLYVRTEISKKLNEYIRDNGLQNEKDRRIIEPNEDLLKLFSDEYEDGCKLDFFTMQKYIKHHYPKEEGEE